MTSDFFSDDDEMKKAEATKVSLNGTKVGDNTALAVPSTSTASSALTIAEALKQTNARFGIGGTIEQCPVRVLLNSLQYGAANDFQSVRYHTWTSSLDELFDYVSKQLPSLLKLANVPGLGFHQSVDDLVSSMTALGLCDSLQLCMIVISLYREHGPRRLVVCDVIRQYLLSTDGETSDLLDTVASGDTHHFSDGQSLQDLRQSPGAKRLQGHNWCREHVFIFQLLLAALTVAQDMNVSLEEAVTQWQKLKMKDGQTLTSFLSVEEDHYRTVHKARLQLGIGSITNYDRLLVVMKQVTPAVQKGFSKHLRRKNKSANIASTSVSDLRDYAQAFDSERSVRFPWETTIDPTPTGNFTTRPGKGKGKGTGQINNGGNKPNSNPRPPSQQDQSSKSTTTVLKECPICFKKGHTAEQCFWNPKRSQPPPSTASGSSSLVTPPTSTTGTNGQQSPTPSAPTGQQASPGRPKRRRRRPERFSPGKKDNANNKDDC